MPLHLQIIDPEGQPLEEARVIVSFKTLEGKGWRTEPMTTRAEGRIEIEIDAQRIAEIDWAASRYAIEYQKVRSRQAALPTPQPYADGSLVRLVFVKAPTKVMPRRPQPIRTAPLETAETPPSEVIIRATALDAQGHPLIGAELFITDRLSGAIAYLFAGSTDERGQVAARMPAEEWAAVEAVNAAGAFVWFDGEFLAAKTWKMRDAREGAVQILVFSGVFSGAAIPAPLAATAERPAHWVEAAPEAEDDAPEDVVAEDVAQPDESVAVETVEPVETGEVEEQASSEDATAPVEDEADAGDAAEPPEDVAEAEPEIEPEPEATEDSAEEPAPEESEENSAEKPVKVAPEVTETVDPSSNFTLILPEPMKAEPAEPEAEVEEAPEVEVELEAKVDPEAEVEAAPEAEVVPEVEETSVDEPAPEPEPEVETPEETVEEVADETPFAPPVAELPEATAEAAPVDVPEPEPVAEDPAEPETPPAPAYSISGTVLDASGTPCAAVLVRALAVEVGAESELGQGETDADGHYAISFDDAPASAVLVEVRLGEASADPDATSELIPDPVDATVINVTLPDRLHPAPTAFATAAEAMDPHLKPRAKKLSARDLDLLAAQSGVSEAVLTAYATARKAASASDGVGLQQAFFACFTQGLPNSLHALKLMPAGDIRRAVATATEAGYVDAPDTDGLITRLGAKLFLAAERMDAPIATVCKAAGLSKAQSERVMACLTHGSDASVTADLAQALDEAGLMALQEAAQLWHLSGPSAEVFATLQEAKITSASALAALSPEALSDHIGEDAAEAMLARAELVRPEASFLAALARADDRELRKIAETLRGFDSLADAAKAQASDSREMQVLALYATAPAAGRADTVAQLWGHGLYDPVQIADAGWDGFRGRIGGALTPEIAHDVFRKAQALATERRLRRVRAPLEAEAPEASQSLAVQLFGPEGPGTGAAQMGPTAYLVDLLRFLARATDGDKSGLDLLRAQRPDILELNMAAALSDVPLPTIHLTLEYLEAAVLKRPPAAQATTWSAEQLRAGPEHVLDGAYSRVAGAKFPWSLPFDRDVALTSAWLEVLELSLPRLRTIDGYGTAWAAALLGLPRHEAIGLWEGAAQFEQDFAGRTATNFETLSDLSDHLQIPGDVLETLIDTPFVTGEAILHRDGTLKPDAWSEETYSRLQFLGRVHLVTGLPVAGLNALFTRLELTGDIIEELACAVACTLRLQCSLDDIAHICTGARDLVIGALKLDNSELFDAVIGPITAPRALREILAQFDLLAEIGISAEDALTTCGGEKGSSIAALLWIEGADRDWVDLLAETAPWNKLKTKAKSGAEALAKLASLAAHQQVVAAMPETDTSPWEVLAKLVDADYATIARAMGSPLWKGALDVLAPTENARVALAEGVFPRAAKLVALSAQLETPPQELMSLVRAPSEAKINALTRRVLATDARLDAAEKVNAMLLPKLRDALSAYLSTRDRNFQLPITLRGGGEALTSRANAAIAAVQGLIQRIQLTQEGGLSFSPVDSAEWPSRRNYRAWRQARAALLLPEDSVSAGARRDQSALFAALDYQLSVAPVTEARARAALATYLRDYSEIAGLEIVSAVKDPARDHLHVLGRSRAMPTRYMVCHRDANGGWSGWRAVDQRIRSESAILLRHSDRLVLLWLSSGRRGPARIYWSSMQADGQWSVPQRSASKIDVADTEGLQLSTRPDGRAIAVTLDTQDGVLLSLTKGGSGKAGTDSDDIARLVASSKDAPGPDSAAYAPSLAVLRARPGTTVTLNAKAGGVVLEPPAGGNTGRNGGQLAALKQSTPWPVTRLSHPVIAQAHAAFVAGGPEALYCPDPTTGAALAQTLFRQRDPALSFEPGAPGAAQNWDLFFHAPMRIAEAFRAAGQFADAQRWLHYVFDPTAGVAGRPASVWRFGPFHRLHKALLDQETPALPAPAMEAVSPHGIGQRWPQVYMRATVLTYVETITDWAEALLAEQTGEASAEAKLLQDLAALVLGDIAPVAPAEDRRIVANMLTKPAGAAEPWMFETASLRPSPLAQDSLLFELLSDMGLPGSERLAACRARLEDMRAV